MPNKKIIAIDFDGVINSFTTPFSSIDIISDMPVPGIRETINELKKDYRIVVTGPRCVEQNRRTMIHYLNAYDIYFDDLKLDPPRNTSIYVNYRAIGFNGDARKLLEDVRSFKTWVECEENLPPKDRAIRRLERAIKGDPLQYRASIERALADLKEDEA